MIKIINFDLEQIMMLGAKNFRSNVDTCARGGIDSTRGKFWADPRHCSLVIGPSDVAAVTRQPLLDTQSAKDASKAASGDWHQC